MYVCAHVSVCVRACASVRVCVLLLVTVGSISSIISLLIREPEMSDSLKSLTQRMSVCVCVCAVGY